MFALKPPMLSGDQARDLAALRDWAWQLSRSLETVEAAGSSGNVVSYGPNGQQIQTPAGSSGTDKASIEAIRKNAGELRDMIVKSAENMQAQIDEIELTTFYVKYADDFTGTYPETMYNTPTANTAYMGVCSSSSTTAPTDPSVYTWSKVKGGSGINTATVFLYRRAADAASLIRPTGNVYYSFHDGIIGEKNLLPEFGTFATPYFSGGSCQWNAEKTEAVINGTTSSQQWVDVYSDMEEEEIPEPLEYGVSYTVHFTSTDPNITLRVYPCSSETINCSSGEDAVFTLQSGGNVALEMYLIIAGGATLDNATVQISMVETNAGTGGWDGSVPATDGNPCFFIQAVASSQDDECAIPPGSWSNIRKLVEDGSNGRTTYLHIKYSDDGQSFTVDPETGIADGETLGTWIGMYTDYTENDSSEFSAYSWKRFSDDTELRQLIATGDQAVRNYVDSKTEEYNSLYVAKSEYGTFTESINSRIETTARGVLEGYNYGSAIQSMQNSINLIQAYFTNITGEIRRGIVQDPSTGDYVTGIAISQNLQFSGECGGDDPNNPGDGYTYYYLTSNQTFGLYTSTGWQFWIDGYKKGWFDSSDGMLHVATIYVEEKIVHSGYWETKNSDINGYHMFEISYIGG